MSPSNFQYDPYGMIPGLFVVDGKHYKFQNDALIEYVADLDEMGLAKTMSLVLVLSKFELNALIEKDRLHYEPEDEFIIVGKKQIPRNLFDLCLKEWITKES